MRKSFVLILFTYLFFAQLSSFAQTTDTTINKVDANGLKTGKWVVYNDAHQKVEEGKYQEGKKVGLWKSYYPSGVLKNRITYVNGRAEGNAVMYHENGKIAEQGYWKGNRWVGEYKLFYDNGQVAQQFNFNESGKREGKQLYYFENGSIMIEGDWREGKESGIVKEYYENGDLRSERSFDNGNMDASKTKSYEPKKPLVEVEEPEQPAAKQPKIEAKPDEKPNLPTLVFNGEGYWKLYNKNKQITKDGVFKKYRMIEGKVFHYDENGILTRIAVYKEGAYVGDAPMED